LYSALHGQLSTALCPRLWPALGRPGVWLPGHAQGIHARSPAAIHSRRGSRQPHPRRPLAIVCVVSVPRRSAEASRHLAAVAAVPWGGRRGHRRSAPTTPLRALALLEGAVAAAPEDPRVLANAARVWYAEFERLRASGILDRPLLLRSIKYGSSAKEQDPDALGPMNICGRPMRCSETGMTPCAGCWMLDAYRLNPTSVQLNCMTGAYLSLHRRNAACAFVAPLRARLEPRRGAPRPSFGSPQCPEHPTDAERDLPLRSSGVG
jgi:hypothetical protein